MRYYRTSKLKVAKMATNYSTPKEREHTTKYKLCRLRLLRNTNDFGAKRREQTLGLDSIKSNVSMTAKEIQIIAQQMSSKKPRGGVSPTLRVAAKKERPDLKPTQPTPTTQPTQPTLVSVSPTIPILSGRAWRLHFFQLQNKFQLQACGKWDACSLEQCCPGISFERGLRCEGRSAHSVEYSNVISECDASARSLRRSSLADRKYILRVAAKHDPCACFC